MALDDLSIVNAIYAYNTNISRYYISILYALSDDANAAHIDVKLLPS